ncbi:hypothetical protein F4777DRAFT_401093 [Nemania sp. FL0916]|nr:hypothetical protein F4777DRAFT_401093 [Nemania sp. FL0916]
MSNPPWPPGGEWHYLNYLPPPPPPPPPPGFPPPSAFVPRHPPPHRPYQPAEYAPVPTPVPRYPPPPPPWGLGPPPWGSGPLPPPPPRPLPNFDPGNLDPPPPYEAYYPPQQFSPSSSPRPDMPLYRGYEPPLKVPGGHQRLHIRPDPEANYYYRSGEPPYRRAESTRSRLRRHSTHRSQHHRPSHRGTRESHPEPAQIYIPTPEVEEAAEEKEENEDPQGLLEFHPPSPGGIIERIRRLEI